MHLVAVVGMTGSGKTEVSSELEKRGWKRLRFGDVTDDELRRRGWPRQERYERVVREELRKEHGMAAYAKMMVPRIDKAISGSHVVVDGLYSWEEYLTLKDRYGDRLKILAVYSSPVTRRTRLGSRPERPLTPEETASRDRAEIENLNKGGPISVADYTLVNEGSLKEMVKQVDRFLAWLEGSAAKL